MPRPRLIAIDGPAASGKSSTARAVARRLGLVHVDSGALYRTAAWLAVEGSLNSAAEIVAALDNAAVELVPVDAGLEVRARGKSIEAEIRHPQTTRRVSEVAAMSPVREWVDRRLHLLVRSSGVASVVDGRDIGTIVFPDAPLKVFLTATPEVRARRRLLQEGHGGDAGRLAAEAERLAERDRLDSGREVAPLRQADDARLLDTTELDFADQVEQIIRWAGEAGLLDG